MQNNGTSQAQDRSLSRRNLLLAGAALTAAAAVPAVEMAVAQQKPAAPAQPKPAAQPAPALSGQKPNILVIMGDDEHQRLFNGLMGYRTPNIDRITKEGMIFTDYYAEQSCTAGGHPSSPARRRCALASPKSGCLAPTVGLQARDPTIAELKAAWLRDRAVRQESSG
jgi:Sulfatase/TAT (twin-arginine translocation) pathway signal sequence